MNQERKQLYFASLFPLRRNCSEIAVKRIFSFVVLFWFPVCFFCVCFCFLRTNCFKNNNKKGGKAREYGDHLLSFGLARQVYAASTPAVWLKSGRTMYLKSNLNT